MLPLQVCEYGYAYLLDCIDVLVNPQSAMTDPERTLPTVSQLLQMALQLDLLQLACATAQNTHALHCKHITQPGTLTVSLTNTFNTGLMLCMVLHSRLGPQLEEDIGNDRYLNIKAV